MSDIILRVNTFLDDDCAESGKLCQVVIRPDSSFTCYHGRAGIQIYTDVIVSHSNLYDEVAKLADVEPVELHDLPEPTRMGDDVGRLQIFELTVAQLDVVLICYALKALRTWGLRQPTDEAVKTAKIVWKWYESVASRYADRPWLATALVDLVKERQYFDTIELIRPT